jgi:hypothetical protein
MKKLAVLIVMVLAVSAAAQDSKPSAAIGDGSHSTTLVTPPRGSNDSLALPVGTAIRMKLETPLSSATAQRGDRFGGRVTEAVRNTKGAVIIPVGAALEGEVVRVAEQRRIKGTGTLDLLPRVITLPDGQRYNINANVVDTSNHNQTSVNDEGEVKGVGHDRGDLIEVGVGTAAGMTIGGIAGGGKGLLIGGAIGGGATIVHWLTKTKTAELPAGTEVIMELSRPLMLSAAEGD